MKRSVRSSMKKLFTAAVTVMLVAAGMTAVFASEEVVLLTEAAVADTFSHTGPVYMVLSAVAVSMISFSAALIIRKKEMREPDGREAVSAAK